VIKAVREGENKSLSSPLLGVDMDGEKDWASHGCSEGKPRTTSRAGARSVLRAEGEGAGQRKLHYLFSLFFSLQEVLRNFSSEKFFSEEICEMS
jgi:hypothetical protein